MSLHTARLSKIIKIAYTDEKLARRDIHADVADHIQKGKVTDKSSGGGGDFHSELWARFKDCIFEHDAEGFDLIVTALIKANSRRKRLFPLLAAGLKSWGLEKRRWMNEEIKRIKSPTGTVDLNSPDLSFKVNNILALEIVGQSNRYIYPYFSAEPALSDEAARVALWQIHKALPHVKLEEVRILDVLRGRSFSVSDVPFLGDEQSLFEHHVTNIMKRWHERYGQRHSEGD
ncbi:hypothetical protein [Gimibacter soli]|uniref:Uncharacterized protein n=1 Tax=Gimibacter soli TaxID=3024400 RepID=A0AAF0BN73_9PROT|nr:hypothetical protein [Gimibacter soli]WCL55546.1 hypothetical protein PH603_07200 [Gimibacter soli]